MTVRIQAAGDAALLVSRPQRIDPTINAWCVSFAKSVASRFGDLVRDTVVGYCTVTVYFDPLRVDADWLEEQLLALSGADPVEHQGQGRVVDVPVCYGGDLGPDIGDVARFADCSVDEVVARHSGSTYRVYLVGFVPGFAYMAEVDHSIATPRRSTPRTAVPAGSVAIAGGQTGIYPDVTPGGWNIIGRTPLKPFDLTRPEPSLFKVGDAVRFHPISREQFASFEP